jgi:hypothetical protein
MTIARLQQRTEELKTQIAAQEITVAKLLQDLPADLVTSAALEILVERLETVKTIFKTATEELRQASALKDKPIHDLHIDELLVGGPGLFVG